MKKTFQMYYLGTVSMIISWVSRWVGLCGGAELTLLCWDTNWFHRANVFWHFTEAVTAAKLKVLSSIWAKIVTRFSYGLEVILETFQAS